MTLNRVNDYKNTAGGDFKMSKRGDCISSEEMERDSAGSASGSMGSNNTSPSSSLSSLLLSSSDVNALGRLGDEESFGSVGAGARAGTEAGAGAGAGTGAGAACERMCDDIAETIQQRRNGRRDMLEKLSVCVDNGSNSRETSSIASGNNGAIGNSLLNAEEVSMRSRSMSGGIAPSLREGGRGRVSDGGTTRKMSSALSEPVLSHTSINYRTRKNLKKTAQPLSLAVAKNREYCNFERFIIETTPVLVKYSADEMMTNDPATTESCCSNVASDKRKTSTNETDVDNANPSLSRTSSSQIVKDPYIFLSDLWKIFKEWSAFGVAVPLKLPGGAECEQCFIPYLSSLHLYEKKEQRNLNRAAGGGNCSDGADDNLDFDVDMSDTSSISSGSGTSNSPSLCSGSDESITMSNNAKSPTSRKLIPLFSYVEKEPPASRIPMYEKLLQLQSETPIDILNMRSDEIHEMSWMSVAWYPIYMIPSNIVKSSACFLTFHSLHVGDKSGRLPVFHRKDLAPEGPPLSPKGCVELDRRVARRRKASGENEVASMKCFGCAGYRMPSSLWLGKHSEGEDLKIQLASATNFWLKRISTKHNDHDFFTRRPRARSTDSTSSESDDAVDMIC